VPVQAPETTGQPPATPFQPAASSAETPASSFQAPASSFKTHAASWRSAASSFQTIETISAPSKDASGPSQGVSTPSQDDAATSPDDADPSQAHSAPLFWQTTPRRAAWRIRQDAVVWQKARQHGRKREKRGKEPGTGQWQLSWHTRPPGCFRKQTPRHHDDSAHGALKQGSVGFPMLPRSMSPRACLHIRC
jgi:hypothetical protein